MVIPDTFPRKEPRVGSDGSVDDRYFDIFVMNCWIAVRLFLCPIKEYMYPFVCSSISGIVID